MKVLHGCVPAGLEQLSCRVRRPPPEDQASGRHRSERPTTPFGSPAVQSSHSAWALPLRASAPTASGKRFIVYPGHPPQISSITRTVRKQRSINHRSPPLSRRPDTAGRALLVSYAPGEVRVPVPARRWFRASETSLRVGWLSWRSPNFTRMCDRTASPQISGSRPRKAVRSP